MLTPILTFAVLVSTSGRAAVASPLPLAEAQFKRDTGLTFGDALSAVKLGSLKLKSKLNRTVRRAELEAFLKDQRAELDRRKVVCAGYRSNQACDVDVKALRAQVDQLTMVTGRFDALAVDEKFALGLLLYQDKMKRKVLGPDIARWTTSCGAKDRVNAPACREAIAKVYRPVRIVETLFLLAQARGAARSVPTAEYRQLKSRITQYESH